MSMRLWCGRLYKTSDRLIEGGPKWFLFATGVRSNLIGGPQNSGKLVVIYVFRTEKLRSKLMLSTRVSFMTHWCSSLDRLELSRLSTSANSRLMLSGNSLIERVQGGGSGSYISVSNSGSVAEDRSFVDIDDQF